MKKPLVSVILPAYNHEKHIQFAIESVLTQTFQDFELLISDDYSTDGTADVIRSYRDHRIKTYWPQKNQGATINHKSLLEKAMGKYIALINSDDVWYPERLAKGVAYLEANHECAACFSWADFIDEDNHTIEQNPNVFKQPNRTQAQWIYHFYTKGNCLCHPSILIRTEVYQDLGAYNLSLRQLPDFDMWVRIIKKYKIHILEESLVQHRRFLSTNQNTSSPTITNSIRDVMESYYILASFFEDLSDELFLEAFQEDFRNKRAREPEELCCEKFFIMFSDKYYIPQISLLAAICYILKVYNNDQIAEIFSTKYNFTLQDLHKITCSVDLLGMLPQKDGSREIKEFSVEDYITHNKAKALAAILLRKNSKVYNLVKKVYKLIHK